MENRVKLSKVLGMLGVAALAVIAARAPWRTTTGWYVGANFGQARAKIADDRISDDLLAEGFAVTAIKDNNRHFGYKLFGGYQFNKYFALEAGYFNLGRFGFTANTLPPAGLTGDIKLQGHEFRGRRHPALH